MTIASDISSGEKLLSKGEIDQAEKFFDAALAQNSGAFKALLGKVQVYTKKKEFERAFGFWQRAKDTALARAKKDLVSEVIYRLAVVYYNKGDYQEAVKWFNCSSERDYNAKQSDLFVTNCKSKASKKGFEIDDTVKGSVDDLPTFEISQEDQPLAPPVEEEETKSAPASAASASIPPTETSRTKLEKQIELEKNELEKKMANHDNLYPTTKNIRVDFFQSSSKVTVTLFVKNLPKDDKLKVVYKKSSISIEFPTSESSEFVYDIGPLYGDIIPGECTHTVYSTKLEMELVKANELKWKKLERAEGEVVDAPTGAASSGDSGALKYPNSSKKSTDWSKVTVDVGDEDEGSGNTEDFFKKLYADADDDTRRAMMKSFTESEGTSLSTNWGEVSKGKVEVVKSSDEK